MDATAVFATLSPADQARLLARHFAAEARRLARASASAEEPAPSEEDERTPAPAPAPVPGGVPGAEEAPVEVVEEAPTELLAISVAASWDISPSVKPRGGKLSRDLKEFVYEDGRLWVAFSYHDNLLEAGLGGMNLDAFLSDCLTTEEKIAKLRMDYEGATKRLSQTVAENIVQEMELFQTPGALFVRKVSAGCGGGIDICRIVGPYHFVPFEDNGKKLSYYAHRCVYEKVRDLTAEEKNSLEESYTNGLKQEQVVRFRVVV